MGVSLPRPGVGWEPVYELLRCLGEVSPDPSSRASHALTLIAGMQAGDPIDEWLLTQLLSLAGLDLRDAECVAAVGAHTADLVGADVLHVDWEGGSDLHRAASERFRLAKARRAQSRHRRHVLDQMRLVEEGLQRALDAVDEAGEDRP